MSTKEVISLVLREFIYILVKVIFCTERVERSHIDGEDDGN
jgi:hypothetical protein